MSNDMTNLKRLGSNKWRIRFKYTDPLTGHLRIFQETVTCSLKEARARRDEAKVSARAGLLGTTQGQVAGTRVKDWQDSFATARVTREGKNGRPLQRATLEKDYYVLSKHVIPEIGEWLLAEIKPHHLELLIDRWAKKKKTDRNGRPTDQLYKAGAINTWIRVMTVYLRHCYRMSGLGESPAEGLRPLPKSHDADHQVLTNSECSKLLETIRAEYPQWYAAVFIALATGARWSEVSALHWDDVDEAHGILHLRYSQYRGTRRKLNKSNRYIQVPLIDAMADVLRWHRRQMIKEQHPGLATPIVFPSKVMGVQNGYRSASGLRNVLERCCRQAGVPVVGIHDMRRTFVTLMLERGIDMAVVQAYTGHSVDETTVHYAHISLEAKAKPVRSLVGELLQPSPSDEAKRLQAELERHERAAAELRRELERLPGVNVGVNDAPTLTTKPLENRSS